MLRLFYDPEKDKLFIQTPKIELEVEENKFVFFDITYNKPDGLIIVDNYTRQVVINSGAEQFVDHWQYKLKIQKRTDLLNFVTSTYIRTIKSKPENPPIGDEQDYQTMTWEKSKEIPSVQISYTYEYTKDWKQVDLISIGAFGFFVMIIKKYLNKKFKVKKRVSDLIRTL